MREPFTNPKSRSIDLPDIFAIFTGISVKGIELVVTCSSGCRSLSQQQITKGCRHDPRFSCMHRSTDSPNCLTLPICLRKPPRHEVYLNHGSASERSFRDKCDSRCYQPYIDRDTVKLRWYVYQLMCCAIPRFAEYFCRPNL